MKKALLTVFALLVLAVAVVLVYASTLPGTFRVERSLTVNAKAEKIYPYIEDFRKWALWSPFETMDPTMKKTFSGAEKGKGAVYAWQAEKMGDGNMEITETVPSSIIKLNINFIKPMKANNQIEFTLTPETQGTKVTWAMTGKNPFLAKIMHVFISMDKLVGKDFENGLQKLKAAAEGAK